MTILRGMAVNYCRKKVLLHWAQVSKTVNDWTLSIHTACTEYTECRYAVAPENCTDSPFHYCYHLLTQSPV
jgi:hypothetical protein